MRLGTDPPILKPSETHPHIGQLKKELFLHPAGVIPQLGTIIHVSINGF